jgi:hypothetical protein
MPKRDWFVAGFPYGDFDVFDLGKEKARPDSSDRALCLAEAVWRKGRADI